MAYNKKRIFMIILILSISLTLISCSGEDQDEEILDKTEYLMDTVMNIKTFDHGSEALLDEAFDRIREIEDKMSVTIDTSDVSLINENAGIKAVKVDSETYFVLEKAKEYAEISNGYYDPTIGSLANLWDISQTDEKRDSLPEESHIRESQALTDYENLELLEEDQVFLKEKGMKLDLGSIAKGYAADQAREVLAENGVKSAIVALGGDVYAYGDKAGEAWRIGVQDPNQATGYKLGVLNIKDKSVVSSGSYERFFTYDGKTYHHIIDPKTGYPSDNELVGVTIISDKSIDGDAISTILFLLGLEDGKDLVDKIDGVEAIFVTGNNEIHIPAEYKDGVFTDLSGEYKDIYY